MTEFDPNKITDMVSVLGQKISDLATQYSTPTWHLVEAAARIDALSQLLVGFACTVIAVIAAIVGAKKLRAGVAAQKEACAVNKHNPEGDGIFRIVSGVVCIAVSFGTGIAALLNLIDPWPWVGTFEPDIWIAHKIILGLTPHGH